MSFYNGQYKEIKIRSVHTVHTVHSVHNERGICRNGTTLKERRE
jgi:hypothetical protein